MIVQDLTPSLAAMRFIAPKDMAVKDLTPYVAMLFAWRRDPRFGPGLGFRRPAFRISTPQDFF